MTPSTGNRIPRPTIRYDGDIVFGDGSFRPLTLRERFLLWYAKKLGALVNLPKVPR